MGYTHHYYVERAYDPDAFGKVASDFATLLPEIKRHGVDLAGVVGVGEPSIGPRLIQFNGARGAACEPFWLEQEMVNPPKRPVGVISSFRNPNTGEYEKNPSAIVGKYHLHTKTEHRPYDLAVMVCLIVGKRRLGRGIVVCSDGSEEKWEQARWLCEHHVGYGDGLRLDKM